MTTPRSLPGSLKPSLITIWSLIDSIFIVTPSPSSPENGARSEAQLRLDLVWLRLSRWSICAAAVLSDPALSAPREASEDLLADLGAELARTLEQGSGVGLVGQAGKKLELTQDKPSSVSSILHARISKLISSRRSQLGLLSQTSQSQLGTQVVALSNSDRSRFDFVTGWTSETLTGLEGLLPAAAEKIRRELCIEEVDAMVAAGATRDEEGRKEMLRDVVDAVAVEVREHRDGILEGIVGARL